ncbi:exodeoxyribonuclease VII small subunit [Monashia sp. NPDC004114]
MADPTTPDSASFPDIAEMGYEDAREELIAIVAKLEAGQAPLEDSMRLWRRGEALAAHCARWLDGAQAEIERATQPQAAAPVGRGAAAAAPLHADDEIFDDET